MNFLLLLPVLLPLLAGAGVIFIPFQNRSDRNRWTIAS